METPAEPIKTPTPDRGKLINRLESAVDAALECFDAADLLELVRARIHRRLLSTDPPEKPFPWPLQLDPSQQADRAHEGANRILGAALKARGGAFDPRSGEFHGQAKERMCDTDFRP